MQVLSQEKLKEILEKSLPDEEFMSEPKPLEGGNLNKVWRIEGKNKSYIIKHAPPYIASAPDIPLDSNRIIIEAEMLKLFESGSMFSSIGKPEIRPPHIYHADYDLHVVIMEDVAPHRELDQVNVRDAILQGAGASLGTFIGSLHRESMGNDDFQKRFDNRSIQKTRLDVQYKQIGALLGNAGCDNHIKLGEKAEQLGRKYLSSGKCLIMGDLWPRSVLISEERNSIRLIDWEFAHYGRPAQDIAHFTAHCWMMAHQASDNKKRKVIKSFWQEFVKSYKDSLDTSYKNLWDKEEQEDAKIHFGCEILARTIGRFQQGYLYHDLNHNSMPIKGAVDLAISSIHESARSTLFFEDIAWP